MEPRHFPTSDDFRRWLAVNGARTEGIWLRIFKKNAAQKSLTYAEALDEALCHGWIDGQRKPGDEWSWLQKFTPRRATSGWSRVNTEHVERLIKAGKITPAGLAAVAAAKADGRWAAAYDSPRNARPPDDFLRELARDKKAEAFFKTLTKTNVYSIVYRLQTARKPATRAKRMKMLLTMLSQGKTFHPQKSRSQPRRTLL